VDCAAVDIGAKGSFGFWRIDDYDNSFCTQPFLVKYSRQDIYLSVMVSFYIPNSEDEVEYCNFSFCL
jgi:hypothetical protein